MKIGGFANPVPIGIKRHTAADVAETSAVALRERTDPDEGM